MPQVILGEACHDGVFIRVLPSLGRVHSEGQLVRYADPVQLGSLSGLKLQVRALQAATQHQVDLLAAAMPTNFTLHCYRSVQREAADAVEAGPALLFGGQSVKLLHKEADRYMQAKCDGQDVSLKRVAAAASSNVIWQVEQLDARDGSGCKWSGRVRLRHLNTGKLLSVPQGATFGDKITTVPTVISDVEAGSTFMLSPQYASDASSVTLGTYLHLQHVDSGYWLHCSAPDAEQDEIVLNLSKDFLKGDVYNFESVDTAYVRDVLYAKSCISMLNGFINHTMHLRVGGPANGGRSTLAENSQVAMAVEKDRQRFLVADRTLTELIIFCSLSDNLVRG